MCPGRLPSSLTCSHTRSSLSLVRELRAFEGRAGIVGKPCSAAEAALMPISSSLFRNMECYQVVHKFGFHDGVKACLPRLQPSAFWVNRHTCCPVLWTVVGWVIAVLCRLSDRGRENGNFHITVAPKDCSVAISSVSRLSAGTICWILRVYVNKSCV